MAKAKVKVPKETTRKHLARAEREARQQRWLIIGMIAVAVIVIGLVAYGYLDENVIKMQQPVATVNGQTITTADFQKRARFERLQVTSRLNQLQAQRAQFEGDPQLAFITQQIDQQINTLQTELDNPVSLGGQVINTMVEEELIRQEAARRNISVSPTEVQTAIEQSYNFYRVPPTATPIPTASPTPVSSPTPEPTPTLSITPTATPLPTETPEPTETPVSEQAFNTQFNSFLSQLAQTGMSQDDFRKLVESGLLRRKLQESFGQDSPPTADQVQFRYIVFETEESAQAAEALLQAGTRYDDLYQGAQVGQIVSATAQFEPWTPVDEITQSVGSKIADIILSLGISQTSQIITGTGGANIILQQAGREVRPLTSSQLQSRQQQAFQTWLSTQRYGSGVDLFNNRYVDRMPVFKP